MQYSYDIVYSQDDDYQTGKGWYVQRFPGGDTSQLFKTRNQAQEALDNNTLNWSE